MSEPAERTFVVTQEKLLELLGESAAPLGLALADSRAYTKAHPGHSEKIVLTVQGGNVTEVEPPGRKWRLLTRKADRRDDSSTS